MHNWMWKFVTYYKLVTIILLQKFLQKLHEKIHLKCEHVYKHDRTVVTIFLNSAVNTRQMYIRGQ